MTAQPDIGGRDSADRFERAAFVAPIAPFEGGEPDHFEAAPGTAPVGHLGFVDADLEQAVDGFGASTIVTVADAADRMSG
jgi:hypothetical protein